MKFRQKKDLTEVRLAWNRNSNGWKGNNKTMA